MTCIVGLRGDDGRLYLGADSFAGHNWNGAARHDRKFFIKEGFAVGYTSSYRMGQILQYHVDFPPLPTTQHSLQGFMVREFIPAIRQGFAEHGFLAKKDEQESGGQFLVAAREQIFEINSDFQVAENLLPYNAVGSGYAYALGALYALYSDTRVDSMTKVLRALQAAESFNGGVRRPFFVAMQQRPGGIESWNWMTRCDISEDV